MASNSSTNIESSCVASRNTDLQQNFMDNSSAIDTFIREKLTKWNLSDYIEIFERE